MAGTDENVSRFRTEAVRWTVRRAVIDEDAEECWVGIILASQLQTAGPNPTPVEGAAGMQRDGRGDEQTAGDGR
ncbi:MAG: hypothetical protein ABEI98_04340 [Halorhabdus sp.]